jgi:hypothetical protein
MIETSACPNCGAVIKKSEEDTARCEYCGSQIVIRKPDVAPGTGVPLAATASGVNIPNLLTLAKYDMDAGEPVKVPGVSMHEPAVPQPHQTSTKSSSVKYVCLFIILCIIGGILFFIFIPVDPIVGRWRETTTPNSDITLNCVFNRDGTGNYCPDGGFFCSDSSKPSIQSPCCIQFTWKNEAPNQYSISVESERSPRYITYNSNNDRWTTITGAEYYRISH